MPKFRKKPVVVEAEKIRLNVVLFDPTGNFPSNNPFEACRMRRDWPRFWRKVPMVETLHGWVRVGLGDWIIRGTNGEHWPCKPDIFEATYEPVEDSDGE